MASDHLPSVLEAGPLPENIPLGLEPLLPLHKIFMRHEVGNRLEGVFGGWAGRYVFYTEQGPVVYLGEEDSFEQFGRKLAIGLPGQLHLRDVGGHGILLDKPRPPAPLSVYTLDTGELLGRIQLERSCCEKTRLCVLDPGGNLIFVMFPKNICSEESVTIEILTQNNVGVGQITRSAKDCLDPGLCFMTFPQDLEVGMKAVLLGALVWMEVFMKGVPADPITYHAGQLYFVIE